MPGRRVDLSDPGIISWFVSMNRPWSGRRVDLSDSVPISWSVSKNRPVPGRWVGVLSDAGLTLWLSGSA